MKFDVNVLMTHFNSFGVPAYAGQLFKLQHADQLDLLVPVLGKQPQRLVLGSGSNILLRNNFNGLVIINQLKGRTIVSHDSETALVEVAAGENWHEFVRWTLDESLYGLENLSLIPGTVGAAPIQNIGAYGVEIENAIETVNAIEIETGKTVKFDRRACRFSYRDSIFKQKPDRYLITSVRIRLARRFRPVLSYSGVCEELNRAGVDPQTVSARQLSDAVCAIRVRKLPDPSTIGNAGSFFKNPVISDRRHDRMCAHHAGLPAFKINPREYKISAAWLIDQCGFKGYRQGDAGVYRHHALVLVNYGNASGEQIWALACTITQAVKRRFGIRLVPEPRIVA